MTITTRLYTYFHGHPVGDDAFGNRYFEEKKLPREGRRKRWVLYKGKAEPSKVPAEWHGWLHYTHDTPPVGHTVQHHAWEKSHLPNLTGTAGAYMPPGHLMKGGQRAPSSADYEPWKP
jgi:NADH:ubiquinone oxidoreductase subunit